VTDHDITGIVVPVQDPPGNPIPAAHPHVTLLAPFRPRPALDPALCAELGAFFATVPQIDLRLVAVREFPIGVRYLAPEPTATFVDLTRELARRYPDTPPYEGLYPDIVPHCTLDDDGPAPSLPIEQLVTEAHLVHSYDDTWDVVARFPLAPR
jgi:hypothetical protein